MKSAKVHVIILFLIMIQSSNNLFSHASYLIYDDDTRSKELKPRRSLDEINNRPITFGSHDVSPLMKGSTSTLNGNRYSDYGSNEYDKNIDLSQYEYSHSAQSSKTLDELRAEHKNADKSSQSSKFAIILIVIMFGTCMILCIRIAKSTTTEKSEDTKIDKTNRIKSVSTSSRESTNTNADFMQIVIAQATLYNKLTDVFDSEIKNALESTQTLDITSRRFVAELVIDNFNNELRAVNYQELGLNKTQSDKILDRINAEMRDKYIINA